MKTDLIFWCRSCERRFSAASEHDEFEQATCEQCSELCMSFEFEFEEAERGYIAEKNAGRGVTSIMFALFGWLGIFASPSEQHEIELPKIFSHMDGTYQKPSIKSVKCHETANDLIRFLGDNGVIANVEESEDGRLLIVVDLRDKHRAKRFIKQQSKDTAATADDR